MYYFQRCQHVLLPGSSQAAPHGPDDSLFTLGVRPPSGPDFEIVLTGPEGGTSLSSHELAALAAHGFRPGWPSLFERREPRHADELVVHWGEMTREQNPLRPSGERWRIRLTCSLPLSTPMDWTVVEDTVGKWGQSFRTLTSFRQTKCEA